jgi:hypothetical protein
MGTAQQKSTESTPRELTSKQAQVISALAHGSTVTDAARLAEVDRTTVYLWLKTEALFVAELNRERRERQQVLRAQLGELVPEALNGLADLLKPDANPAVRLRAIMFVLQAYGVPGGEVLGPTDPDVVERDRRHAEAIQRQSDFLDSQFP